MDPHPKQQPGSVHEHLDGLQAAAGKGQQHSGYIHDHIDAGKGQQPKQVRKWLSINSEGIASSLELSKLRVTHQLGIQLRDLRLLDPHLATSYPSAILARERAIIVNLEFIKMIIGLDRCFITHLDDPNTALFVEELQRRLQHPPSSAAAMGVSPSTAALSAQLQPHPDSSTTTALKTNIDDQQQSTTTTTTQQQPDVGPSPLPPFLPSIAHLSLPVELPFELRVLECALDVVSRYLEQQTSDLEAAAHPALDALTKKITTSTLERVRRIKNRMVRLTTRVETLKELLEKLLDDDSDMKDLNLTAKEAERFELLHRQSLRTSSTTPFDVPLPSSGPSALLYPTNSSGIFTPKTADTSSTVGDMDEEEVEVVEQLLESYFMILDNTWNKLQTLTEYIDDTEDFINIELDSHRNQLIRLDLVLTSFTACMGLVTAITGLFAMNVVLDPRYEDKAPYSWFVTIAVTSGVIAIVVFSSVMIYCKWKRLM